MLTAADGMTLKNPAIGTENGTDNGTEKVLVLLADDPTITIKSMSEKMGFSVRKTNRLMKELHETGKITRIGPTRKGSWKIND